MIDEIDLLMEYNKDLSRKEAEKIVEKNKESMSDPHYSEMEGNKEENAVEEEENVSKD